MTLKALKVLNERKQQKNNIHMYSALQKANKHSFIVLLDKKKNREKEKKKEKPWLLQLRASQAHDQPTESIF